MKKFFIFSLAAMMAVPAFAATTRTTSESTYEDPTTMEAQEYDSTLIDDDAEVVEVEEMEEKRDEIDYSDRTRTNRERKALNTGSHASDDH